MNDEVVGVYNSAQAAADDVFTCSTGGHEWDRQGTVNQPTDIHEWEHVKMGLLESSQPTKSRSKLATLKPGISEAPPLLPVSKKRK